MIPQGEGHRSSVLTDDQVRRIRTERRTDQSWGAEFGVSSATVTGARTGRTWAHMTDPPPVRRRPGRPADGGGLTLTTVETLRAVHSLEVAGVHARGTVVAELLGLQRTAAERRLTLARRDGLLVAGTPGTRSEGYRLTASGLLVAQGLATDSVIAPKVGFRRASLTITVDIHDRMVNARGVPVTVWADWTPGLGEGDPEVEATLLAALEAEVAALRGKARAKPLADLHPVHRRAG